MKGDDTFVVYSRPRMWLPAALFGVTALFTSVFAAISLWRLDPAILGEGGVLIVLASLLLIAVGCGLYANHNRKQNTVIFTADALGVSAGVWTRRLAWSEIDTVSFATPFGVPRTGARHLVIRLFRENETALGQKIEHSLKGRNLDMRWMRSTEPEVAAGMTAAAALAGFDMTQVEATPALVWRVRSKTDRD